MKTAVKSWYELNPPPVGDAPVRQRSGCKVGWDIYADETRAREMGKYYAREADHKADQGYDFGYCSPGSVTKVADGWEVCKP